MFDEQAYCTFIAGLREHYLNYILHLIPSSLDECLNNCRIYDKTISGKIWNFVTLITTILKGIIATIILISTDLIVLTIFNLTFREAQLIYRVLDRNKQIFQPIGRFLAHHQTYLDHGIIKISLGPRLCLFRIVIRIILVISHRHLDQTLLVIIEIKLKLIISLTKIKLVPGNRRNSY